MASFEDRQRPFLLGKTVTGDIFDLNGQKIAAKGDLVTDEIFDLAKSSGSSKLIELTIKVSG